MAPPKDEIEGIIEKAIADLYVGFFRLRKSGQYQREYDTMGHVISLLMQDREHIRKTHEVKP